jgi:hypothetical protein
VAAVLPLRHIMLRPAFKFIRVSVLSLSWVIRDVGILKVAWLLTLISMNSLSGLSRVLDTICFVGFLGLLCHIKSSIT